MNWECVPPSGSAQADWLDEIREFRARVLYENGRRPWFRRNDGRYNDGDPLDRGAYHISVRMTGGLVGCVRLLPMPVGDLCLTEQLIGSTRFAQMLRALNVNRGQVIEGGRWVVDPMHRGGRLGVLLAAGGIAIAEALKYRMLVCPVGTAGSQDRVLARLGVRAVAEQPLIAVPHLDDTLRVMHVFPSRVESNLRELMDSVALKLKLRGLARADEENRAIGATSRSNASVQTA